MRNRIKSVSLAVVLFMIFSFLLVPGCTSKTTIKDSESADKTKDVGEKEEGRVKLNLFMTDSGVGIPEVVDISNNEFISFLEDYANVELEVEVPSYQDFQTKANLMLASGNIPDIVHSYVWNDMEEAAIAGAFVDIKPFYDKSVVVKKVITSHILELNKAKDGKNYCMPMAWNSPAGYGNIVRVDLLKKHYNGKMPETVDEWVDCFKTIKKEIGPTCIPITCRTDGDIIFNYGQSFWLFYGIQSPQGSRVTKDEIIPYFILPEYREALLLWKELYKEGILDQEFAVITRDKRLERIHNNHVAMWTDGADQVMAQADNWIKDPPDVEISFIPPLKEYPDVLKDINYAEFGRLALPCLRNSHGVYISSDSKYPDRAWRVIEGLASDEFKDLIAWGREGIEHKLEGGERVPIEEKLNHPDRHYSLMFAVIHGFPTISFSDQKLKMIEMNIGSERYNTAYNGLIEVGKRADKMGINFWSLYKVEDTDESKEIKELEIEGQKFIATVVTSVIMGKMPIEEYDNKVEEYRKKYGDKVFEYYTKKMLEQKDYLVDNGVKFH